MNINCLAPEQNYTSSKASINTCCLLLIQIHVVKCLSAVYLDLEYLLTGK